ncbi:hypothetical protein BJV82DRAFT_683239 [Fennellomyces sp. T-0311]|nr:hypothetical protein BJV82DRAFT_683239 [Fennellomyces sp. T-0311]
MVHVMTVTGQSLGINVSTQAPVINLKQAISDAVADKSPDHKQRLYFNETELQDDETLASRCIKPNATIYMLPQIMHQKDVWSALEPILKWSARAHLIMLSVDKAMDFMSSEMRFSAPTAIALM